MRLFNKLVPYITFPGRPKARRSDKDVQNKTRVNPVRRQSLIMQRTLPVLNVRSNRHGRLILCVGLLP